MSKKYRRPALNEETWKALDDYRSPGQTPDGAIRQLLKEHGKQIEVQS